MNDQERIAALTQQLFPEFELAIIRVVQETISPAIITLSKVLNTAIQQENMAAVEATIKNLHDYRLESAKAGTNEELFNLIVESWVKHVIQEYSKELFGFSIPDDYYVNYCDTGTNSWVDLLRHDVWYDMHHVAYTYSMETYIEYMQNMLEPLKTVAAIYTMIQKGQNNAHV